MKINADEIARTALRLLNEVGLDGLTMRLVAKELGVQAAALYWHVRNKRLLLDAMAAIIHTEGLAGLDSPGPDLPWDEWCAETARGLRAGMLRYRDGARVFAGTHVDDPLVYDMTERTLRILVAAGFPLRDAARGFPTLFHFTVGFTIEEQARAGTDYGEDNPYRPDRLDGSTDAQRFPLLARAIHDLFDIDADASFEYGVQVILDGMKTQLPP
jgi:TetR/AcrR family tetracycline transcriptional repressor